MWRSKMCKVCPCIVNHYVTNRLCEFYRTKMKCSGRVVLALYRLQQTKCSQFIYNTEVNLDRE